MLLVVPVSDADAHLFQYMEKAFALYSPGAGHDLLVVGSPNVVDEVKTVAARIGDLFNNTSSYIFTDDSHLGWPMACNFYFQQTAYYISQELQGKIGGWMWYELDATPIKSGWLNQIQYEYQERGKPFMGAKEKTMRGENGALLDDAGYHMVATGVYPIDIIHRLPSLGGVSATMLPWWEFLQWQIVPNMHETKLIQENWRTLRYRNGPDGIVCDSDANLAWTIDYNRVILDDTVVVHGCKDGSLTELLSSDNQTVPAPTIEEPRPLPKSRQMSKSARQARVERYAASQLIDHG